MTVKDSLTKTADRGDDVMANMFAALGTLTAEKRDEMMGAFWKKQEVGVEHSGKKITLPAEPKAMSTKHAIEALQRYDEMENQVVDVVEVIEGYPLDAAVAFVHAMRTIYGWAQPVPTPGFFGPTMPAMRTVQIGPNVEDTIQVPTGSFKVPGIANDILMHLAFNPEHGKIGACIHASIRNAEREVIMDLINAARGYLAENSIYRGKALKLEVDDDGELTTGFEPEFLKTAHIIAGELILNDDTDDLVQTNLFTPIRHTAACRENSIPLRRGVLLSGIFGTGKSMTGAVLSKVCVENGWTFIHIDRVQGLKSALAFAKRYQPAVLYAEDIDRAMEERDESANDLLNQIDGVLSKGGEIITVLTTNYADKIEQAMIRPGRIDVVVNIEPPDAKASQKLVRLYARGKLTASEDLSEVGEELSGQIPATIREVVERAKLGMIRRGDTLLNAHDLYVSAVSMRRHLALLNKPADEDQTPERRLGDAMAAIIRENASGDGASGTKQIIGALDTTSRQIRGKINNVAEEQTMAGMKAAKAAGETLERVEEKVDGIGHVIAQTAMGLEDAVRKAGGASRR